MIAIFGAGWISATALSPAPATAAPVRVKDPNYPLISPLVGVAFPATSNFPELAKVNRDVQAIVDNAKASGAAEDVGVYFRVPANAHAFGINADKGFDPGSLLKVPIMIAYLKEAEGDPRVLLRRYAYVPEHEPDPSVPNELGPQLKRGTYSAQELIEAMIETSDNVSKDILTDHADPMILQDVFDEMAVNFLKDPSGLITPRQYVTFFSRLYSAAYLDRENSNRALAFLTNTAFTQGLIAELPKSIRVAHKYGERGVYQDGVLIGIELHDCGIVYAPENPYYLCVMTRGTELKKLSNLIADISAKVFADRTSFVPTK
jgi:beta-lactamase class A